MILQVSKLSAKYGQKKVLFDVSMNIGRDEIVALIGPNGAGKTTAMKSIFSIHHKKKGEIIFKGQDISKNDCAKNLTSGLCYVPQGGRVFNNLTVRENLLMGGYILKNINQKTEKMKEVYKLFPILKDRINQMAGTLSGGERQMLAMSMPMMLTPKCLLLDEPSIGLAPSIVPKLMQKIKKIKRDYGTSVLVVEQNARQVLKICDRVYVMKVGRITDMDKPEKFSSKEELRKVFFSKLK